MKVACKDLGADSDCDFVAEGETKEDVIKALYDHAGEAHPEKLQGMSEEDKAKIDAKINELLDAQG